jgi:hypothetical protein
MNWRCSKVVCIEDDFIRAHCMPHAPTKGQVFRRLLLVAAAHRYPLCGHVQNFA